MNRLRLYDLRTSRLMTAVGECREEAAAAIHVNTAQARLLNAPEAGDEGWWGTWAEIAFNVSQTAPYFTLPRGVARLEKVVVCDMPVPLQNQFYDYLDFGNGRMPRQFTEENYAILQVHSRNNVVFFTEPTVPLFYLRAYCTASDADKRILYDGLDASGNRVYTQDSLSRVTGVWVTLSYPFVTSPLMFTSMLGIQKDVTADPVSIYQVDPTTGTETLLLTMEPSEQTAWYRRYYVHNLPTDCQCVPGAMVGTVQLVAICKLDLVPVTVDSDYCLLTGDAGKEAIILEAQAVRMEMVDNQAAQAMAINFHRQAIRMLNGQLTHYLGTGEVALSYSIFGNAPLANHCIGHLY